MSDKLYRGNSVINPSVNSDNVTLNHNKLMNNVDLNRTNIMMEIVKVLPSCHGGFLDEVNMANGDTGKYVRITPHYNELNDMKYFARTNFPVVYDNPANLSSVNRILLRDDGAILCDSQDPLFVQFIWTGGITGGTPNSTVWIKLNHHDAQDVVRDTVTREVHLDASGTGAYNIVNGGLCGKGQYYTMTYWTDKALGKITGMFTINCSPQVPNLFYNLPNQ